MAQQTEKCVVLYIRLSAQDVNVEEKGESNSIKTQRLMLHRFLDKHPDLSRYPRFEAVDDGYSGTNGNRPMLQKVLDMAENGEVKAICVKDNSRFFRNYQKSAFYLDVMFPQWGVRFLSATDGYDSDNYKGITSDLEQSLKNIIYAQYPKMLSHATVSAKVRMMKEGKYVGGFAPYGYAMHPSEKYKLVIDPESAQVVRRIFLMAGEGNKTSEIARTLNLEGVETPAKYFRRKNPDTKKFKGISEYQEWTYGAINQILGKYLFTGAMVSHRAKTPEVGSRTVVKNEPIIVEDMHEGIVTKEEFEQAQKVIKRSTRETGKRNPVCYPLVKLVRCGYCKKIMQRSKREGIGISFQCRHQKTNVATPCSEDWIPEATLEELVLQKILTKIATIDEEQTTTTLPTLKENVDEIVAKASKLQLELKRQKRQKLTHYDSYCAGDFSKEEFLKRKKKVDKDITTIEENLLACEKELENFSHSKEETEANHKELETSSPIQLTQELARKYVRNIYCYDKNNIEIELNQDEK